MRFKEVFEDLPFSAVWGEGENLFGEIELGPEVSDGIGLFSGETCDFFGRLVVSAFAPGEFI